ncbi:hypothetical protein ACF081_10515 [Streptomyces longwoodensis]|uniref:hypothetical protein n=1 Tax=Streptomyces longwoodensis TaxID=68231 RepID=UPI0037021B58
MSPRQAFLTFVFYFWFLATSCQLVAYYVPWVSGTREPGRLLGRVPLLKRLGRHTAETRLGDLKGELTGRLDPQEELDVLVAKPLVDQVHAHATWAQLSRIFIAAPGILACVGLALVVTPSTWRTWPLWSIGTYLAFILISTLLTCIDIWAVRNADPAGAVSDMAVRVLESFTTHADKAPSKSTTAAWQSQMVERLCGVLLRRAHRESAGAVPGSRLAMAQSTASAVRALRHRSSIVHGFSATDEERTVQERELWLLICSILRYSSRVRADVTDFRVVDGERLADVPDTVPDATALPSPKARVLVPLLFFCALVAVAVGLGATGAAGEMTTPIVAALALAATPFAHRFGVTVIDSFVDPLTSLPVEEFDTPRPLPESVRQAA